LLAILVLVPGLSGCLSIHSIKESLLYQKAEPEVVYWKSTPIEEYWEASQVFPADTLSKTPTVRVKDGAKWLNLKYDVDLPSSLVGERQIANYTIYFNPEVTLRLRNPYNVVYWEDNITETESDDFKILGPSPGIWTLRIEATGYGGELLGIEARDKLRVVVDLYEPK
jgi:hypothetical protein